MAAVFSSDSSTGRHFQTRPPKSENVGIGELLKGAREHHGLTLEQVARETKIPRRHLEALEHGTLAALPPFYQRAEIRTYARALNLDPGLVLARLERELTPSVVVPNAAPAPPTLHRPSVLRNNRLLIACGLVLTAIVVWREIPQDLSLGVQTEVAQVADSTGPAVSGARTPATDAADGIDRTELDQNPPVPVSTTRVPAGGIEPADARPTGTVQGDLPAITKQGDERPLVEQATELIVRSEPAGARVTVDGIGWGVTPVTIRYLEPGTKRVRVSMDGYATREREVRVDEGRRQTTDIRLSNSAD